MIYVSPSPFHYVLCLFLLPFPIHLFLSASYPLSCNLPFSLYLSPFAYCFFLFSSWLLLLALNHFSNYPLPKTVCLLSLTSYPFPLALSLLPIASCPFSFFPLYFLLFVSCSLPQIWHSDLTHHTLISYRHLKGTLHCFSS